MVRAAIVWAVLAVLTAGSATAHATSVGRHAGLTVAGTAAPVPMVDSAVAITARGPLIETVVTQRFDNRSDHAIEAIYVFPLPDDAAVSAMSFSIGSRTIHGAIEPREAAKQRYEAAVAAGVSGALLEQERPDIFTQTIAAIPPHAQVAVTLRYDSVARLRGDHWELALPMVVAPRYVPGTASGRPTTGAGRAPDTDRAPDASRVTPATDPTGGGGPTAVAIAFTDAVDDLTSPTHELAVGRDRTSATLTDAASNHDAIVRWRAAAPVGGWIEQDGTVAYAAIVVAAGAPAGGRHPTRWLVALDRSATTHGATDTALHPLVHALLDALAPGDRVSIIGSDRLAAQAPAAIRTALDARWATAPGAFDLTRTLAAARPAGAAVILISGGLVADDAAALAAARALGVPVHVIGVGAAPARGVLAQLAAATAGTLRYATPGDDLTVLAHDVIADAGAAAPALAVNWGTLVAHDVVPAALPRLGAGQAMLVVARVPATTATTAHANGRAAGEVFAIEPVRGDPPIAGATTTFGPLARRWGRLRLDDLLAARAPDARAITAHALAFGLVSPYTALVAIGDDVVVEGGVKHTVAVPVAVPAGMRWQDVRDEHAAAEVSIDTPNERQLHDEPKPTAPTHHNNKTAPPAAVSVAKTPVATPAPARAPASASAPAKLAQPDVAEGGDAAGGDDDNADQPRKARRHEAGHAPARDEEKRDDDDDDAKVAGDVLSPKREVEATEEAAAAGVAIAGGPGGRARFGIGVAGGLLITSGSTSGLVVVAARAEYGWRTRLGGEAALWLVDAQHPEGNLLATLARDIGRLELTGGVGVHVTPGAGPAIGAALRWWALPRVGLVLRYDAALRFHAGDDSFGQAVTLGLELDW